MKLETIFDINALIMENVQNTQETAHTSVEKMLALVKDAHLSAEELKSLATEIIKLAEAKRIDEVSATDVGVPMMAQETAGTPSIKTEKDEERNQFGLPHSWAKKTSLKGLEIVRQSLERAGSLDSRVASAALRDFLVNQAEPDYRKYRGEEEKLNTRVDVRTDNRNELAHLALPFEERLASLVEKYPTGLKLMDSKNSGKYFIRWDKIVDFEAWAMSRHSQTFATLNRRGGLSPHEAASIIFAVPLVNYPEEALIKFLQENGFLAQ